MGRPTTTRKYPAFFWQVLKSLKENPAEPVLLPCSSKTVLNNIRLNFLSFRNAAVKEGLHLGGENRPEWDVFPDLDAYTTKVKQDGETFVLEIWHTDYTPESMAMAKALDDYKKRIDSKNQLEDPYSSR